MFITTLKRADGNYRRRERIDLATNDALQCDNQLRGNVDGVDRLMRIGTMASYAPDLDIHAIRTGLHDALAHRNQAARRSRTHV